MPCGGTFAHRRATPACLPPPNSRRRIVIAAPPRLLVGSGHFRPVGGMVGGGDDAPPGCWRPPTCRGSGGGEFLTAGRLRPARHLLRAVEASFRAAAPRAARRRGRCWRAFRCATMGAGLLPGRGTSPPRPCSMGAAALLTPRAQDSHHSSLRPSQRALGLLTPGWAWCRWCERWRWCSGRLGPSLRHARGRCGGTQSALGCAAGWRLRASSAYIRCWAGRGAREAWARSIALGGRRRSSPPRAPRAASTLGSRGCWRAATSRLSTWPLPATCLLLFPPARCRQRPTA